MKEIEVAAAIIESGDKILIGKRAKGKSHAGQWEFPGGKIESDESPERALKRELGEELGVESMVHEKIFSNTHQYPNFSVNLHFFRVDIKSMQFVLTDHETVEWVSPNDLLKYNLSSADVKMAQKIQLGLL